MRPLFLLWVVLCAPVVLSAESSGSEPVDPYMDSLSRHLAALRGVSSLEMTWRQTITVDDQIVARRDARLLVADGDKWRYEQERTNPDQSTQYKELFVFDGSTWSHFNALNRVLAFRPGIDLGTAAPDAPIFLALYPFSAEHTPGKARSFTLASVRQSDLDRGYTSEKTGSDTGHDVYTITPPGLLNGRSVRFRVYVDNVTGFPKRLQKWVSYVEFAEKEHRLAVDIEVMSTQSLPMAGGVALIVPKAVSVVEYYEQDAASPTSTTRMEVLSCKLNGEVDPEVFQIDPAIADKVLNLEEAEKKRKGQVDKGGAGEGGK